MDGRLLSVFFALGRLLGNIQGAGRTWSASRGRRAGSLDRRMRLGGRRWVGRAPLGPDSSPGVPNTASMRCAAARGSWQEWERSGCPREGACSQLWPGPHWDSQIAFPASGFSCISLVLMAASARSCRICAISITHRSFCALFIHVW
ncbi:hypothetical protein OBBRIDRAFT_95958 [Obba rivulosa]|uniref:Secreted protein n=1 Tax=Obba rivulosa TaxID=1052685 RepID=A0A8E2AZC9_9APHY|nr:hypothetical protein OBBRIDRAFT_95958 [Obba rivulosa]